jgi:nucleoside-diphosphate-sugar epimerase
MSFQPIKMITGASGFIGSALCAGLSSPGQLIGVDIVKTNINNPDVSWVQADLTVQDSLINIFECISPNIIIHCAGIAHQKIGTINANTYLKVNSETTEILVKSAAAANPNVHFIFLSSISVYGESHINQPVLENAGCSPSSDYAFSKLDAERRLVRLYEEGLFRKLTILRLASVYDREWSFNLDRRVFAPKKITYLKFGKGSQRLSALARPNLVEFVEYLLQNTTTDRSIEIMNVCDTEPYSFNEIILAFKKSGIFSKRPTVRVPLSIVWLVTRAAGLALRSKKDWLKSCYDKLASDLVFDNSKMIMTGFKPRHTLKTIFS